MRKGKNEVLVASATPHDGIIEMVYKDEDQKAGFAACKDGGQVEYIDRVVVKGVDYESFPATSDLIRNKVVRFPAMAEEYGGEDELVRQIRNFIRRYLDISPIFERIATYYVLFTWVYDRFNELPYLRVSGDYGSGKSRFLNVVGSICYRPIFTGGATTTSPLFRMIDTFKGTLIIDEADFRFSDTTADVIKILNSGYQRNNPVLRSEGNKDGHFDVKAFDVYCPKIIATRKSFDDIALESRCLTEELEKKEIRSDIPINIPDSFEEEALRLRNQLLMWRFRNFYRIGIRPENVDRAIEPRLAQIMTPLLSIVSDENVRADIQTMAREYNAQFLAEKHMGFEAEVFETLLECFGDFGEPTIQQIADRFNDAKTDRDKIQPRRIGSILRKQFKMMPKRTNAGYAVSEIEHAARIELLKRRYGFAEPSMAEVQVVHEVNQDVGNIAVDLAY